MRGLNFTRLIQY